MAKNETPPSSKLTAFDCPHCGVLTTQYWLNGCGEEARYGDRLPDFYEDDDLLEVLSEKGTRPDRALEIRRYSEIVRSGGITSRPAMDKTAMRLGGLCISLCFSCRKGALWVDHKLVWPEVVATVEPNDDLPSDVRADFIEARSIVHKSPRGAAALMRLVVQKLCAHLGGDGKNIDADIATLVSKGLSPMVQQALDVVRVVGNNAVHPGQIDLRDDPGTVMTLFSLVNAIADQMISQPKRLEQIYQGLPAGALSAIEARNAKALGKP